MQFASYSFIFLFMPVVVTAYFLLNRISFTMGKLLLICASIFFFSYGRKEMFLYLCLSIGINYFFVLVGGKCVKQRFKRFFFALPIIVNIGLLCYFKYTSFLVSNINLLFKSTFSIGELILPLSISFYTFQQIAYVVAVFRGELKNINILDYLAFILFFPKLLMGPLMDPVDFIKQINDDTRKKIRIEHMACGLKLFSFGLFKKVLIADTFSRAVSQIFSDLDVATAADCLLLVLFYTFEIYFDFSGYCDMATGVSQMFNIELPINFDSPYKALSIRDFWKRWHISLTSFFTKYVYIPLGGNRKGVILTYLNVMIVFVLSGFWHGANWTFVLWGILHGFFSCIDRAFDKMEKRVFQPVRWTLTFFLVSILWLLFRSDSIVQWKEILKKILFMQNTTVSDTVINSFELSESKFLFDILHLNGFVANIRGLSMILFIIFAFIICLVPENSIRSKNRCNIPSVVLSSIAFVWGVLCLGTEVTFVYYGF